MSLYSRPNLLMIALDVDSETKKDLENTHGPISHSMLTSESRLSIFSLSLRVCWRAEL
jgi:hypothetical protein